MSAMAQRLAASSGPSAESALLDLCRTTLAALMSLEQQLETHPSRGDGTGSMRWAGLLAWPAASLTAAPGLLPQAGPDILGELVEAACGVFAFYTKTSISLGADAVAEVQSYLPGALRVVLHAAGRLAMPGEVS